MSSTDRSINRLLGDIRSEERAIDAARASRSAAKARMGTYQKRLEELNSIKSALAGAMNDRAGDVLSRQRETYDLLSAFSSGYGYEGVLQSQLQSDQEKSTEADGTCSQVHEAIQSEMNRCKSEIEGAQAQINAADAQESSAQSRRSSYLRSAQNLAKEDDATVRVNARARY